MDSLYIENSLIRPAMDDPASQRAARLIDRFPQADVIPCERYGEVFNPKNQDFRAQKSRPALLVARKFDGRVLPTPVGYGVGGEYNYYFAHMLNCVYDCRYCFLQGMYRSANYVLFVNYEDYLADIDAKLAQHDVPVWFFSGYDCDSLAFEPVSGFADYFLPAFAERPQAFLELRTKSTQIRSLLNHPALPNVVVAFSLSPSPVVAQLEHQTASLDKRLDAISRLIQAGWPVGLRFDPIIDCEAFESVYSAFFKQTFDRIEQALTISGRSFTEAVHSISLGTFRLPKPFFKRMVKLYPREPLFNLSLTEQDSEVSYPDHLNQQRLHFCQQTLARYSPVEKLYTCQL